MAIDIACKPVDSDREAESLWCCLMLLYDATLNVALYIVTT
jgi:hypothetical protein